MSDWFSNIGMSGILPASQSARELRQRIALAMLMKKRTIPDSLGGGIASLGESFADALNANRSVRQTDAQSAAEDAAIGGIRPTATTGPRADDTTAPAPAMIAALPPAPPGIVPPTPPQQAPGAPVSPPQPQAAAPGADPWVARSAAIGGIESGGARDPYTLLGARTRTGDRAYGKYQVMGNNVPGWTQAALGTSMTPQQFLANKDAQEAVFRNRFGGYVDKYGEEGAAKAWYAGERGMRNPNATDVHGRLTVAGYGQDYMNRLGGTGSPRDNAAAILASRPPEASDLAQEERLSDVMGSRQPQPLFAPTASNRTGDIQSDLPPVTGAVSGPMGASVGDTVQARQETLRPPQGAVPTPPPGPQIAQAPQPNVFPPVSSDAPKAIIPGGGFPPTMPTPQIPSAPQDPRSAVRSAPETYVPKNRPRPEPPSKPTMGPVEQQMNREYMNRDISPRIKAAAQQHIDAERAQLNSIYENQLKNYTAEEKDWQEERKQERDFLMRQPKTEAEIDQSRATTRKTGIDADKAALELGGYPAQLVQEKLKREAEVGKAQAEAEQKQEEARIVRRTGMEPVKLYERLDKEKASVEQTLKAQDAQQLARRAIRDGVITGYGANGIVAGAKFADWAFKNGMSGNLAANTETMSAALKAGLSEAVKTVNGEGGTGVSNVDVRIAEGIAGSDPGLQLKTIRSIMDRAAEINHRKIDSYESKVERYLSGEKAEDWYKTGGSTVPPDKLKILLDNPSPEIKAQFNEVYGPGAADLQLSRFRRAQQRQGRD